jgi:membrane peptidoglycan carboxypeptidase
LTQQLIKNLILTREKTITRKLKEIVLALKLNSYLEEKIKQQYKNLTKDQVRRKVKEKILEMYLNYVFL